MTEPSTPTQGDECETAFSISKRRHEAERAFDRLYEQVAATRPEPDYRALALQAVPLISSLCTTASRFAAEDWLAEARKEGLIP